MSLVPKHHHLTGVETLTSQEIVHIHQRMKPTQCYGATGGITRIGAFQSWRVVSHLPSLATPPGQPGEGAGAAGVHDIVFDDHWRGVAVIGLGGDPAQRALLGPVGNRFGRLVRFRIGSLSFGEDLAGYEATFTPVRTDSRRSASSWTWLPSPAPRT